MVYCLNIWRDKYMTKIDSRQTYQILQNLSNLEISFMEYAENKQDFVKYQTYLDYFNSYVIRSHNLSRFYFPMPESLDLALYPKKVTDIGVITESLNILPGYDFSISKQFNFPGNIRHQCDYYALFYLMEGQGCITIADKEFEVKEGDFYLIPPHIFYSFVMEPESVFIGFNLRKSFISAEYQFLFHDEPLIMNYIIQTLNPEHQMTYLALHTCNSERVRELVLQIFVEYMNEEKYCSCAMKQYFSLIFISVLRSEDTIIDSSIQISRTERQYEKIIGYLKQNYKTATLTDVAEHIHFSKQYICKIVRLASGRTFNEVLTDIRLDMVRQYLTETKLSLESIAEYCGFCTASHLSKVFKRQYGEVPSNYRKRHRADS